MQAYYRLIVKELIQSQQVSIEDYKQTLKFTNLLHKIQYMEAQNSTLSHSEQYKLASKLKPELQSINKLYNDEDGSECNYCHKGKSYSIALVSQKFEPYTYQTMMERGWRRCGTYYYKPDLQKSCCKQWTHRLDVNQFKMKKDQKKTIKKMMTLAYEPIVQMKEQNQSNTKNKKTAPKQQSNQQKKSLINKTPQNSTRLVTQLSKATSQLILNICKSLNEQISSKINELIPKQQLNPLTQDQPWNFSFLDKLKSFNAKPEQKNDFYCNWGMLLYGCNKSKFRSVKQFLLIQFIMHTKQFVQRLCPSEDYHLTMERGGYLLIQLSQKLKEQKNEEFQIIKEVKNQHKQNGNQPKQKIQQEPRVSLKVMKNQQKEQGNQKIQIQFQKNPEIQKKTSSCRFQNLQPQLQGELIITTNKITFGKITIHVVEAEQTNESFLMYQRYCKIIHEKQQKGFSSYTNFLCQKALALKKEQKMANGQNSYLPSFDPASLHQSKRQITGPVTKLQGCYHMKYYLEDKFIAVGVIDILPNGLSSVYFFYEPEYKDRRLGVFSSLIEIQYVRYLSQTFPQFKYYYMGFYIHDNDKMSYKGDYAPYQLLCPITYNFVAVDEKVKQKVNKIVREGDKNIRLAPQGMQKDPDMNFTTDLGVYIDHNIKLTYKKKPLKLKEINPEFYIPVLQLLKAYLSVWGKELFEILTFTF